MIAELERRAQALADPEAPESLPVLVALYVLAWLSKPSTLSALARDLSPAVGYELSRGSIAKYLQGYLGDDAYRRLMADAREQGADARVDLAEETVSADLPLREDIQRAKLKADVLLWRAGREGSHYREKSGGITLNVETLHITALRAPEGSTPSELARARDALPNAAVALLESPADAAEQQTPQHQAEADIL